MNKRLSSLPPRIQDILRRVVVFVFFVGNSTATPVVSNLRIDPALVEWVFTLRPLLPSSIVSTY